MGNTIQLAIGCFTEVEDHTPFSCGEGIKIISFDENSGVWGNSSLLDGHKNPSYLDWDSTERILYAIADSSDQRGEILVYKSYNNKRLYLDSSVTGPGNAACHLKGDFQNQKMYAVSYDNGTVITYNLDHGEMTDTTQNYQFVGQGPNKERQEQAHAHQVIFHDNSPFLYICDLGTDRIWMNSRRGGISHFTEALTVPEGYGPRHMDFDLSGEYAFILCELVPHILLVQIDKNTGKMGIIQDLPTVDSNVTDITAPAAIKIHPSGKTVVVSNRFHDSITVFTIDYESDKPSIRKNVNFSSQGKTPREISFTPSGKWLLIANQDSSDIQVKSFDPESGLPRNEWSESLKTPTPVCIISLD